MGDPLLLINVPDGIQRLYQSLTTFITEQCGLSIRYVSSQSLQHDSRKFANLKSKIRDAIINNDSLRMRPLTWKLDKLGHVIYNDFQFDKLPQMCPSTNQKIQFKDQSSKPLDEALREIDQIVKDVLMDRSSILKLVGLDVNVGSKEVSAQNKVMIPLWGWGLSAAETQDCKDREIKFIFSDERIRSEQLQVACLLHSLIEACWWYPQGDVESPASLRVLPPAATDDNKKLVSCVVDENLCYCNMMSVILLQRLQLFDQHYQAGDRAHTVSPCSCQKLKTYRTSMIMKKVASMKNILRQQNLDSTEFHEWISENITEAAAGLDPALRLYLGLLKQEVSEEQS